jgi:hypothetical protein
MEAFPHENLTAKTSIPILQKTQHIVERCFLINLDRREDRLTEWLAQLPQPWPFPEPERFAAIDSQHHRNGELATVHGVAIARTC